MKKNLDHKTKSYLRLFLLGVFTGIIFLWFPEKIFPEAHIVLVTLACAGAVILLHGILLTAWPPTKNIIPKDDEGEIFEDDINMEIFRQQTIQAVLFLIGFSIGSLFYNIFILEKI